MKIYTKTGDGGDTGLWGGERIPKDHARLHAYGTVDECNAILGVIGSHNPPAELLPYLKQLQNQLFDLGADLSAPMTVKNVTRLSEKQTEMLENWIDQFESDLPPLTQFILPGGHISASYLHQARTVCRRAERWAASLMGAETQIINPHALKYLNRLSDLLFVMARWVNLQTQHPDVAWEKSN